LPSFWSSPLPPTKCSAPSPPLNTSSPLPPTTVMASSAKAPLTWSIRTVSSPARRLTLMAVNASRAKLASATPSSPKSTWSVAGSPVARRRARLSFADVPLTTSVWPARKAGFRDAPAGVAPARPATARAAAAVPAATVAIRPNRRAPKVS
jgi:hypothetical protein